MPNGKIPALRLKQWLSDWDGYEFEETAQRRKPEPYIYLFSMPANQLRKLSDVYRREREVEATEGIQRARDDNRTSRIRRYIKYGYPFGDLRADQQNDENLSLRKPGLPNTASPTVKLELAVGIEAAFMLPLPHSKAA